jgi:transposase InsO family protein
LVELIVEERARRTTWGGRKLKWTLENQGHTGVPAPSTITAILRRKGLLNESLTGPSAFTRFEKEYPNELWQMDFKGDFVLGCGSRCHPLTILDDHSRYVLCIQALPRQATAQVQETLTKVFQMYGLPKGILCDNGSPWGSHSDHGLTPLGVWLLLHGVDVLHGRPYHPQTQGKLERFHRTLKEDVVRAASYGDMVHVQSAFDAYRVEYNTERPHESLGLKVPSACYQASLRAFPAITPEPEFEPGGAIRKVQKNGFIAFKGKELRVPKALCSFPVALYETDVDGVYDVKFCHPTVAQVDLR